MLDTVVMFVVQIGIESFIALLGTVVALEKEAGILRPEHQSIIEAFRNKLQREFKEYLADTEESESICTYTQCKDI